MLITRIYQSSLCLEIDHRKEYDGTSNIHLIYIKTSVSYPMNSGNQVQ